MFSHIMIGTNDLQKKAKTFYDAVLGTLGVPPAAVDGHRPAATPTAPRVGADVLR